MPSDKEIALKLAKRLIQAELNESALQGYLDALGKMEQLPVDWQRHIRGTHVLPEDLEDAQMREGELAALVHEATEQDLLRILYRKLLQERT